MKKHDMKNYEENNFAFLTRILFVIFLLVTLSLANFDRKEENDWREYTYTTNVPGAYDGCINYGSNY